MIVALLKDIRLYADALSDLRAMRRAERGNYRKLQSKRIRDLVKHAFDNVELYRCKYKQAGIRPEDIQTIADMDKLPVITRQDLVDGFPRAILASNCRSEDCRLVATSGSTGTPLRVFKDRTLLRRDALTAVLANIVLGRQARVNVGTNILAIEVDSPASLEAVLLEEVAKLPRFLSKSFRPLDALKDPHEHIRVLAECRPDILFAYPSNLRNMAITVREEGLRVHQPKIITSSAELLDDHTRRTISSVFKGEMLNFYASTEGGLMAMECSQHRGMHIISSRAVLELVRDGKAVPPGVPGTVVVTNLSNWSTPIIRYSGMGDVAVFESEPCPCGDRQPVLKVVEGRLVDSLVLSDGRLVHPFTLTLALENVPMIAKFQIVQECLDSVKVLIVPETRANGHKAICEETRQNLRGFLGEKVQITVDLVGDIPESSQPGFHTVKSLVAKKEWQ